MDKCVPGCKHYYGGELKHHKDCVHYPESLSKMWDDAQAEITLLREFARVLLDDDYLRASAMVAKNPTLANLGSASVLDKT